MKFVNWLGQDCPSHANIAGWRTFQLGLFLLPSSALLSGLFLVFSIVLGSRNRANTYLEDPWNWPLVCTAFLMLIGSFYAYSGWLAWVGLANWLPFFWSFWAFQPYLVTAQARRRCSLWLLAGTFPVLITGFGQLWWGWHGPWELLNGTIVWFVSPGGEPEGRLSGLFDYANIAGAWLAIIWPFCLAALLQHSINLYRRSFVLLFAISHVAALILTDSRNAWGGLVLAIPFVIGPIAWPWLLPIQVLVLLPVVLATVPGVGSELQIWARKVVPESLWSRLNDMRYMQERSLESTRISQWSVAIKLISEQPWLGWGAAAFSILYPLRTGQWHGHSHNLPLEIAVSHGLPVSLLLNATILALLITALRRGVLVRQMKGSGNCHIEIFDRAWWSATFILVLLHGADIPLFDSRLNIAGWILLSGLRCLIVPSSLNSFDSEPLVDDQATNLV